MLTILAIAFIFCLLLGVPIAFSMGAASLLSLLLASPKSLIIVPSRLFGGLDSFPLMAVPFFILAGKLMEEGDVSTRLVNLASALVGFLKGGLAMVSVIASVIFAGISGSAAADTSAMGSLLIPSMVKQGYKKGFVACLFASSGTIGPVIPPSLLMIIYSSVTGLSVASLFLAGFLPGILMAIGLLVICYLYALKYPEHGERMKSSWTKIVKSFKEASLALLMPVIIIGGIISGVFTATESAAVAVVFAFILGTVIYKKITFAQCWRILAESAQTTAVLMMMVSMATLFGWILGIKQFPKLAVDFLLTISSNPPVVLFLIILFLLAVGCFIETIAAMIILIPVLHPVCLQFGFDPIHFAIVVIITLLIGAVTPPVGILLFLSCGMTKIELSEALKYVTPFIVCLIVVALIVAYFPGFVLLVPKFFIK